MSSVPAVKLPLLPSDVSSKSTNLGFQLPATMPADLQHLLLQFQHIFSAPEGLPQS